MLLKTGTGGLIMTLEKAIEMLRENLEEAVSENAFPRIEFNLGYAAAIRDLEHIKDECEEADNGRE